MCSSTRSPARARRSPSSANATLALSAQARAAIEEIDAALGRLDDGVYGICAVSGQAIPKERLEAIPWATERVEYKVGGFGRR